MPGRSANPDHWNPRLYEWYFTRTPIGRRLRAREDELVFGALDGLLRGEDTVLDVGCGTGRYTLPLARRCERVVALDASPAMLEHLEARLRREGVLNVESSRASVPEDLRGGSEAYDGIVMIGVFSYIAALEEGIAALASLLKPEGWLLFTVVPPSLEGKVHRLTARLVGTRVYVRPVAEVQRAARAAGLDARHLGTDGLTRGGIDSLFVARPSVAHPPGRARGQADGAGRRLPGVQRP